MKLLAMNKRNLHFQTVPLSVVKKVAMLETRDTDPCNAASQRTVRGRSIFAVDDGHITGTEDFHQAVGPHGQGRVFVTTLGHDAENVKAMEFKVTFARGAEWAATGKVTQVIPPEMAK